MKISFILVEPQLPENIGAAARALKTMGFTDLRLVRPCDHLCDNSRWMAYASEEILERAAVYEELNAALADIDFCIGSTARRRHSHKDYLPSHELGDHLRQKIGTIRHAALLFGREDRGLLNEEIERCDLLTTIPLNHPYPSLNLAQAVMVYAYELSRLGDVQADESTADQGEWTALKERIVPLLQKSGLTAKPRIVQQLLHRLGYLSHEDVRLLHSLCAQLEKKL
jgi:tRNA/rRNA methyltransferase